MTGGIWSPGPPGNGQKGGQRLQNVAICLAVGLGGQICVYVYVCVSVCAFQCAYVSVFMQFRYVRRQLWADIY